VSFGPFSNSLCCSSTDTWLGLTVHRSVSNVNCVHINQLQDVLRINRCNPAPGRATLLPQRIERLVRPVTESVLRFCLAYDRGESRREILLQFGGYVAGVIEERLSVAIGVRVYTATHTLKSRLWIRGPFHPPRLRRGDEASDEGRTSASRKRRLWTISAE
jgi:hypothetical protein